MWFINDNQPTATPMTEKETADIFVQNIKFVRVVAFESAPNKSLVEDIVHDTFIRFVENADKV